VSRRVCIPRARAQRAACVCGRACADCLRLR
jgi:hypothetical protein